MTTTLIGSHAKVVDSPNRFLIGLNGTVLDETKNMVTILTERGPRLAPKMHNVWEIRTGSGAARLDGSQIAGRFYERMGKI